MNNHLTDKEIASFVSGFSSKRETKRVMEHISSCIHCRKQTEALSSVLEKQPPDSIPGEHVRSSVMAEWHRVHNLTIENNLDQRVSVKKYYRGFAAAFATVIVAVSTYMFLDRTAADQGFSLVVSGINGQVKISELPASEGALLKTGSVISTDTDGRVTITSDGYSINLDNSTSISVISNSKKEGIKFSFIKGFLHSKSTGNLRYSYQCGKFIVFPVGTEFDLRYSGENLDAEVTEGKIAVYDSDFKITVSEGQKWNSVNPDGIESVVPGNEPDLKSDKGDITKPEDKGIKENNPQKEKKDNGSSENKKSPAERKEKLEKIKSERELLNEMKQMKKEQRQERKGKNRD